ncbi:MAG: PilN domain-containing protein [Alphaproteobacteria bacterium]|nr:PilN domain-containing protein [Alphaproteobacteria bacterium]
MIRINLLPVRTTKRQETVRSQLVLAGVGAVALVVALFLVHGVMLARVASAESDVSELKAEVERMQATAAQAEQAEKLKADLQKKLEVIKTLKANRSGPVRMMDELADATPDKLTLTSLDEKKGKLNMGGFAVSNEVISQFLSNLEQSDYFEDVYLNSIEQSQPKGAKEEVKVFSITARLVVPGVEAEAAPTEGKQQK